MILRKKRSIAGLAAAAAVFLTSGCSAVSSEPMTYTDTLFDSVISLQIYDKKDRDILEECKELCQKYDAMFSRTNEESEVSRINNAQGNPVEVSPDTVTLQDPAAAIDLGAVAKGYIADRLKEYLEGEGVHHALINLGGNVLAVGDKPDGSPFHIGIQKPFDKSGIPLTSVRIDDKSIVTSGTYQRYFEKDGALYHHILDAASGYPCNNGLASVSIITDSSLTADALSTTCFLLGPEKGMNLVNQLENVEAVFVDTDNRITYSNNFQK